MKTLANSHLISLTVIDLISLYNSVDCSIIMISHTIHMTFQHSHLKMAPSLFLTSFATNDRNISIS